MQVHEQGPSHILVLKIACQWILSPKKFITVYIDVTHDSLHNSYAQTLPTAYFSSLPPDRRILA